MIGGRGLVADGHNEVCWAARVNPSVIRRLYETDALGIVDDELIDKVGFALYSRCQSILEVTEAHEKRLVKCPRCGEVIVRPGGPSERRCDHHLRLLQLECALG